MTPEQADAKLPKTPDGRHIVTLMEAPDAPGSFVSLVDKGANLRRVRARKGLEDLMPPPAGPMDAGNLPVLDLGQNRGEDTSWFLNLFRGIFSRSLVGKGESVRKDAGEAHTFAEALAPAVVRDQMWDGFDALRCSLISILEDPTKTDKQAAWALSIGQFSSWALSLLDRVPATKRAELVTELQRESVSKAGRVLSAASLAKLTAALESVKTALAELDGLKASAEPAAIVTKQETDMGLDVKQIAQLADEGGQAACRVRKALHPASTVVELEAAYAAGSERVVKALAMQPGIPQDALQNQMAMQGLGGSPGDPLDKFTAALNALGTLVRKQAEQLDALAVAFNGTPAGADGKGASPGIVAVVSKQGEALMGLAGRVSKMAAEPAAPSRAEEAAAPVKAGERAPVTKGALPPLTISAFAPIVAG